MSDCMSEVDPADAVPVEPIPFVYAEDDISLASKPGWGVDYLDADWDSADLWSSYRHISSHRNALRGAARLENALWRVWTRDGGRDGVKLGRVDPRSIHWYVPPLICSLAKLQKRRKKEKKRKGILLTR